MRVVMLSLGYFPDQMGGAYRYVRDLAVGLAARGHEVHVIYPSTEEKPAGQEHRDGVRLIRFEDGRGNFLSNWRSETRDAARLAADLTRTRAGLPTVVMLHHGFLAPAVPGDCPVITAFYGPWAGEYLASRIDRRPLQRLGQRAVAAVMHRVERSGLARATSVVVLSEYSRNQLAELHPGLPAQVDVVPGAVDLARFSPPTDRLEARRQLGIDPGTFLLVALRRLDARMGLDFLVKAMASLDPARVRLWIGGRGPEHGALERLGRDLGLGARFRLLGMVSDEVLPRLYAAADLVVMPSLDLEGFGLVTAEALACGTPVIGSASGATPELLKGLSPGLLFERGSVESIAHLVGSIVAGRTPLPDRAACRAHAEASFAWDRVLDAWEGCMKRVTTPPAGGSTPDATP